MAFRVSNSFKRGTVKTYTKQRVNAERAYEVNDRPRKKICMGPEGHVIEKMLNDGGAVKVKEPTLESAQDTELPSNNEDLANKKGASSTATLSSPPAVQHTVLSPGAFTSGSDLSSPPSSPPELPSPLPKTRKPTFSFLKRKRDTSDNVQNSMPLQSITANAQKGPRPAKKVMKQMQIDLGGDVRKKCRVCGMEYIPSVREDAMLHKEFCGMNTGGIEMGKLFVKDESVKKIRSKRVLDSEKETILVVDEKCSVSARHKAQKVLDVVNAELNAAVPANNILWTEPDSGSGGKQKDCARKSNAVAEKKIEQFKVFLHMIGERCVGFCLAEKISEAYRVVDNKPGRQREESILSTCKSSSVSHSTTPEIALLGISRVWTSRPYRGRGLAINLLECARSNFFFGVEVPRHLVAFSQPTESGGKLAQKWFGSEKDWHVYSGSQV